MFRTIPRSVFLGSPVQQPRRDIRHFSRLAHSYFRQAVSRRLDEPRGQVLRRVVQRPSDIHIGPCQIASRSLAGNGKHIGKTRKSFPQAVGPQPPLPPSGPSTLTRFSLSTRILEICQADS